MKRILLAIAMIVLAGSTAFATTRATWTDTVTVTNNQVQTGTADLQVSTTGIGGGAWNTSTKVASIALTGLIPGGAAINNYDFSLWNNSTPGVSFDISTQATSVTGSASDQSKLLLEIYENGTDPETGVNRSGWITLEDWQTGAKSLGSNIAAAGVKDYRLAAKLDTTATNDWQGRTVTITFTVTGTQP